MNHFFSQYATAIFTLAGTIAGASLTLAGTWALKKKELKLRLWEKVLDRRIEAHEKIVELAKSMRIMQVIHMSNCDGESHGLNYEGELARTPALLNSKETFEGWYGSYTETQNTSSTWLSSHLIHELNLLQDYLVNLHDYLLAIGPENYQLVGAIIRTDFLDFSETVERLAFEFFTDELPKLKMNDLRNWHKYPLEETKRRLAMTALFTKRKELMRFMPSAANTTFDKDLSS